MPTTFDTPEQWRSHAKEARALAKQMRDPEAKIAMLRVAECYDTIAKRAEAKLAAYLLATQGSRSAAEPDALPVGQPSAADPVPPSTDAAPAPDNEARTDGDRSLAAGTLMGYEDADNGGAATPKKNPAG